MEKELDALMADLFDTVSYTGNVAPNGPMADDEGDDMEADVADVAFGEWVWDDDNYALSDWDESQHPRDEGGKFTGEGGGGSEHVDAIADYKPERPLTGPDSRRIDEVIQSAKNVGYFEVPGIAAMHKAMGVDQGIQTMTPTYNDARKALFAKLPVTEVPFDKMVFTQPRINLPEAQHTATAVKAAGKLKIPTDMVQSGDKYYVINGHHRVVANYLNGKHSVAAKVFNPFSKAIAASDWAEDQHPRADDGKFTDGEGGGPSFHQVVDRIQQPDGGFTYHAVTGAQPTTGYALSLHKDRERVVKAQDVTYANLWNYAKDNWDLLNQDGNYFGGWHDPESGNVFLDVSTVVNGSAEAAKLGKANGQLAYFDLHAGKSVSLKEQQYGEETGTPPDRKAAGRPNAGRSGGAIPQPDWQGTGPTGTRSGPQGPRHSHQAIAFATPKLGPKPDPKAHLVASAKVSAQSAADKLLSSALAESLRLKRAGWEDDEVEDALKIHLGELSDSWISRLATMAVNEAFSMGRGAAAQELADQIGTATYTAILDENVCKPCEALDGEEFDIGSDEYEANMPPYVDCEGGDQCRCVYLYVLDEGTALADWQEEQHPRADNGKFTDGSGGGDTATAPLAHHEDLARQAATATKHMETLVEAAVVESGQFDQWQNVPDEQQEQAKQHFIVTHQQAYAQGIGPLTSPEDEWNEYFNGNDKMTYAVENGIYKTVSKPTKWVIDNEKEHEHNEDYERTRAVARELVNIRTQELMTERGLGQTISPADISSEVWSSWKEDSHSPLAMAMQLAASRELGGVSRLTPEQEQKAFGAARNVLVSESDHNLSNTTSRSEYNNSVDERTMGRMQAYVRAQWETTQFLLDKTGQKELTVYRGLVLPKSALEKEPTDKISAVWGDSDHPAKADFRQLTNVQLKRNGLSSTTLNPQVANTWNGVDYKKSPSASGDYQRVVVRYHVPKEAVFSLPVYGQNVYGEKEVVLLGTKTGVKWDAWLDKAPAAKDVPVKMAEWQEDLHPRGDDGQFVDGGGGSSAGVKDPWKEGSSHSTGSPEMEVPEQDVVAAHHAIVAAMGQTDPDALPTHVYIENHHAAVAAANVTASVMKEMKDKGYAVPQNVIVYTQQGGDRTGGATVLQPKREQDDTVEIYVPHELPRGADLDKAVDVAFGEHPAVEKMISQKFAVRTMKDVVVHEMGHVQAGYERRAFKDDSEKAIAGKVSLYATHNAEEFIAEAFVRQYRGETLAPDVIQLYQRLKGPAIKGAAK